MDAESSFDAFVVAQQRLLWQALVPLVGPEVAADALADALLVAWQRWDRVAVMENPAGYVYVVARRRALRLTPATVPSPVEPAQPPEFEPGLVPALARLSEMQRTVVYLVEGFGWGLTETARLLDISISTVRNHLARALDRLRADLEVSDDA
jgi:RNA polymerase sigma factor (sigma-70 family)